MPAIKRPTGYGALVVAGLLALLTAYIVYGIITMEVPDSAQPPGPKFFPTILAVLSGILCVALVVDTLRHPHGTGENVYLPGVGQEATDANIHTSRAYDARDLGIAAGSFAVFIVILEPVGWIISAALLFWAFTYALGSRRYLFNLGVAIAFSSTIQAAFSAGLGLSLPAGVLGGIF